MNLPETPLNCSLLLLVMRKCSLLLFLTVRSPTANVFDVYFCCLNKKSINFWAMKIYFLVLIFDGLSAAGEDFPAKRHWAESSAPAKKKRPESNPPDRSGLDVYPSDTPCDACPSNTLCDACPSNTLFDAYPSDTLFDAYPSDTLFDAYPSDTLFDAYPSDTLCDACFNKINDHSGMIKMHSVAANVGRLRQYLKIFNDNYRCYKLSADEKYGDAVEVLFEADQRPQLSIVCDLTFESKNEMGLFSEFIERYRSSLGCCCRVQISQALSFYTNIMYQVFDHGKPFEARHHPGRRRASYYDQYRILISKVYTNGQEMLNDLNALRIKMRDHAKMAEPSSTEITNLAAGIYSYLYDAFLPRLAKLSNLTDAIVFRALSSFVHDQKKSSELPVSVVSFQPVYAFAGYQARSVIYSGFKNRPTKKGGKEIGYKMIIPGISIRNKFGFLWQALF